MVKKLRWLLLLLGLLFSAYCLCDIGVVRPAATRNNVVAKEMIRAKASKTRRVRAYRSTPRSKTATALLLCLSDCLKYIILALVVTGKANECYEMSVEFVTRRRSAKVLDACQDKRWLKRIDKSYKQWLSVLQDPESISSNNSFRFEKSLFFKGVQQFELANQRGEHWIMEDVDVRDVRVVYDSATKKIFRVGSFMRRYAVDKEGCIVAGSKDFLSMQEELVWRKKRDKTWCLVDVYKQS